jgi:hypothetical protein
MAVTNHERVGKGLDLLKGGPAPFVELVDPAHSPRVRAEALASQRVRSAAVLRISTRWRSLLHPISATGSALVRESDGRTDRPA